MGRDEPPLGEVVDGMDDPPVEVGVVDRVVVLPVGTVSTTTGCEVEESAGDSDSVRGAAITLVLPRKNPNPTDKAIALKTGNLNDCSDMETSLKVKPAAKLVTQTSYHPDSGFIIFCI